MASRMLEMVGRTQSECRSQHHLRGSTEPRWRNGEAVDLCGTGLDTCETHPAADDRFLTPRQNLCQMPIPSDYKPPLGRTQSEYPFAYPGSAQHALRRSRGLPEMPLHRTPKPSSHFEIPRYLGYRWRLKLSRFID